MLTISADDIRRRIERDNPWWQAEFRTPPEWGLQRRSYFKSFARMALNERIKRAAVLLGPRRVGKTVLAKQLVAEAIERGFESRSILYASIDTPVYAGMPLEQFLRELPDQSSKALAIFDEIQYLKNWEGHLKDLVDSFPNLKIVASGSAAAALRLKSGESGAGRFSEFMLPPLTFEEFLQFVGKEDELIRFNPGADKPVEAIDIEELNRSFIDYLNFGGFPEAVFNDDIRADPEQFVRNDIIDKVLLKDLPALYGINDIQELNKLFSFLAYNAGNEANLEGISRECGLTKPTIKKYIEYLESAFLIIKVSTVDQNCRSMQRERNFKIYLNNPSMRAALFGPVGDGDEALIGRLAESAIFAQWQHSPYARQLRYARWRDGEVDMVYLDRARQKPRWAVEIKWSDRPRTDPSKILGLKQLAAANPSISTLRLTSRTIHSMMQIGEIATRWTPTSLYCYIVGRNAARVRGKDLEREIDAAEDFSDIQADLFEELPSK